MWSGIDKRRFPRAKYNCLIVIKAKDASRTISTTTENIGGGGICVILNEDLGLFRGVDIELSLDDGKEPVKGSGTIVWVVKKHPDFKHDGFTFDTGVEFVDIDAVSRDRVLKAVDAILGKQAS